MTIDPWRRSNHTASIGYSDMGFGTLSLVLSTVAFMKSLPISREGHEFAHDVTTISFMISIILNFFQMLEAVKLLNSAEIKDDPYESKRLAKEWQNWCLLLLVLLAVKLILIFLSQQGFWFFIYTIFICLELSYRMYWWSSVQDFISDLETVAPTDMPMYSPYLWS